MFLQVLGTAHKKGQRNNGLEKKRTCIKFVKYKMSAAVKIDECVRLRGFVDRSLVLCTQALHKSLLYIQGIIRDAVFFPDCAAANCRRAELAMVLICFQRGHVRSLPSFWLRTMRCNYSLFPYKKQYDERKIKTAIIIL